MFLKRDQTQIPTVNGKKSVEQRIDLLIKSIESEIKDKKLTLDKVKKAKSSVYSSNTYSDFEKQLDEIFGKDTNHGIISFEKFQIRTAYNNDISIKDNWRL